MGEKTRGWVGPGERWRRHVDARPRLRRALACAGSALLIIVGIGMVWAGGHDLDDRVDAWRGVGTPGTIRITEVLPHRWADEHTGDFTSDDGTVTAYGVQLVGDRGEVGSAVRAFAPNDTDRITRVYAPEIEATLEGLLAISPGVVITLVGGLRAAELVALRRTPSTGRHARRF